MLGGQVGQPLPGAPFQELEALGGDPAVGGAGQRQDRLARADVGVQPRPAVGDAAAHRAVDAAQVLDLRVDVDGDGLGGGAEPVQQRAERGHLRRRPRRSRVPPRRTSAWSCRAPRAPRRSSSRAPRRRVWPARPAVSCSSGAATRSLRTPRCGPASFGERLGDAVERVEVGAGLPRRVDRRGERVDERVHVGAVQVVLLVPGGRRQHHVGEQRGRGHPEVQRQQQVELALAAPRRARPRPRAVCSGGASSARSEESVPSRWRRKYSLPLAEEPSRLARHTVSTRGQFCGASGSVQANPSRPSTQRLRDMRGRVVRVGGERLVGHVERVAVERRHRRHPAQPRRLGQQVGGVPAGELARGQRRGEHVGAVLVVAPLVGVQVPVRGADHLPRRAGPVQPEGQVRPAGDRAALLLPDVVRPAAAVDALAAGQRGQRQHRPVGGVGVEPVVGAGPHEDHRPAAGAFGVVGELAGDPGHRRGRHAGDRLLPRRGVRLGGVVVAGGPLPRQPGPATPRTARASGRTRW